MNTYKSLITLSTLLAGPDEELTSEEIVQAYNNGQADEAIAYVFCRHYQLLRLTANKFFGLSAEDKDSYMLEEINKALSNYDKSKGKITTLVSTYLYNRLRTETQALQSASRATLNLATSFEDLGELDRIEEASDESSYSFTEMYYLVSNLDLTENERKCCELILLNPQNIKNSEIAEVLGLSRAGVGDIKKRLKVKLAPIFDIAV